MIVTSGQALVRLSSGTAPSSLDAALQGLGATRGTSLGNGWVLIRWSDSSSVASKLPALGNLPGVAAVQPSHVYKVHRVPNDTLVGMQYALQNVDAFRAWELETGGTSRVTVAVIDTGIDGSHPDLSAKFANTTSIAYDPNTGAVAVPNDPLTPACEHATEVAGVAAASSDNSLDIAGMSWGAQLVSLKVFADADCDPSDCDANTACNTNDPAMISAINYAAGVANTAPYGRVVVNMSLGCSVAGSGPLCLPCTDPSESALAGAVASAIAPPNNVVIVAAAGNDGTSVNNPGDCPGVIPAGATDSNNSITYFSSNGPELASGGVVAPGSSVLTTAPGGATASVSGTSFASPMVAGTAALLLSAKPSLTPAQVQADIRGGAVSLGQPAVNQGAGLLSAYNAISLATTGSLPPANGVNADAKPFAFPNPFRLSQESAVEFSIPPGLQRNGLDIKIYTLQGGIVRDLSEPLWDGKNTSGNLVASGSYVFVVTTSNGSARGRMAVIR
jgi:subtilisin family serine protease